MTREASEKKKRKFKKIAGQYHVKCGGGDEWTQSAVILEPPKIKSSTVSMVSPSISHEVMGLYAMILVFYSTCNYKSLVFISGTPSENVHLPK